MSGAGFLACASCGWHGRPRRLWCPRCAGRVWQPLDEAHGEVLAVTSIRRAAGEDLDPPFIVALVRLDGLGGVIATCQSGVEPGNRVTVTYDGGAFTAIRS